MEFWLPIIALLGFGLLTSANLGYAKSGGAEVYDAGVTSNPIRQASFLGLAGAAGLLWLLPRRADKPATVAWTVLLPLLVTTTYLIGSIVWSDAADTTLKRSITAVIVVFVGISIGRVWDAGQLARGVLVFSLLFLLFSIAAELWYGAFRYAEEYRFSGLVHPIRQAFNCVSVVLASLVLYSVERRRFYLVLIGIAVLCLVATKARTGVVSGFIAGVWILWQLRPMRLWVLIGALGLGGLASGVLLYQAGSGRSAELGKLASMGRDQELADPTKLTGRWEIWEQVVPDILRRPLLGYGYGAYWNEGRWTDYERATGWPLYHSHSAYFEVALGLGAVGLLLAAWLLAVAMRRSDYLAQRGDPCALLVGGLILMSLVGGIADVSLLNMEFESVLLMIALGVIAFSVPRSGAVSQ